MPAGPDPSGWRSRPRTASLAAGKALSREEQAKRAKDPLALHDEIQANARDGVFPKGTDVFLYKFSGLFHVAPAQDAFMCRLRIPGGALRAWQFRGVADLARRLGGGYADVTTRANLQIREIGPRDAADVLEGLADLGIITRGSGADNIRNVTASPTAGIDPQELIETLPLAKEMHHYILNHREMYGLPRKFNIAFDGGGRVASLDDTNDIGFRAVRVPDARPTTSSGGRLLPADARRDHRPPRLRPPIPACCSRPDECVAVAAAIVRVFIRHGDRTDRKKARLKYLLDDWGFDRFLGRGRGGTRPPAASVPARPLRAARADEDRWAHVGFHPQKQAGRSTSASCCRSAG